ncbi:MAG: class III signal peptide-containing protein [Eggerthellaceae bacterium]|nr:class III signal peptide-containing protein [Eggerthellaceae bacterium]
MDAWKETRESLDRESTRLWVSGTTRLKQIMRSTAGQGTTEYAILVGVLVVIAILAIMVFRPKLQELWNAIADGINGL